MFLVDDGPLRQHLADLAGERVHREGFGDHRHVGAEEIGADRCILGVARDEQDRQVGTMPAGDLRELAAVHAG